MSTIQIPQTVTRRLAAVERQRRRVLVATVIVRALAVLLIGMLLAMAVDWMLTLFEPASRAALTLGALTVAGLTLLAGCFSVLFSRRTEAQAARDVDIAVPALQERFSTLAELAAAPDVHQRNVHRGMLDRLTREALSLEPHVVPDQVVSRHSLVMVTMLFAGVAIAGMLAFAADHEHTGVLLQRFWAPTQNISLTAIALHEPQPVVAEEETYAITAQLVGRPVMEATLFIRWNKTHEEELTLTTSGTDSKELSHRIQAVTEPFEFRIRAGDGQTEWHDVEVARRPEIRSLRTEVIPPAYTGDETREWNELPARIRVMQGSRLRVALKPREYVENAEILVGTMEDGARQAMRVDDDGWYRFEIPVEDSVRLSPILTESHGLVNRNPQVCELSVFRDEPPTVNVTSPSSELAVRPDDKIEIEFTAEDDIGISRAELIVYNDQLDENGQPQELQTVELDLTQMAGSEPAAVNGHRQQVTGSVPLDLSQFDLENGRSISYAVRVYDTREEGLISDAPAHTARPINAGANPSTAAAADRPDQADPAVSDNAVAAVNQTARDATASPINAASAGAATESSSTNEANMDTRRKDSANAVNDVTQDSNASAGSDGAAEIAAAIADPASRTGVSDSGNENSTADSDAAGPPVPASDTKMSDADRSASSADSSSSGSAEQQANAGKNSRSLNSGRSGGNDKSDPPQMATTDTADSTNQQSPENKDPSSSSATSNPRSVTTAGDGPQNQQEQSGSTPSPGDEMTRRQLDIAQSASSNRMQIKIDEFAGSFDGQQRVKLEIAISPVLQELNDTLQRAENHCQTLFDHLQKQQPWAEPQRRRLGQADASLRSAISIVEALHKQTVETPYAFVGLQVTAISQSHIEPAGEEVWAAIQSDPDTSRRTRIENAWQHIARARERLLALTQQFERVSRDHQLAEELERVKKMYRVFVEDAMALLNPQPDAINNYQRKMAQMELDDEYLKRLEEVLKLQKELRAELARILQADPRLLKRFTDQFLSRSETIRDQLTLLAEKQKELERELRAMNQAEPEDRAAIRTLSTRIRLNQSQDLANATAELQEKYLAWRPFNLQTGEAEVASGQQKLVRLSVATRELAALATRWRPPTESDVADTDDESADEKSPQVTLSDITKKGHDVYELLNDLDGTLRQMSIEKEPQLADFTVRRLADTRRLIRDASRWVHAIELIERGQLNEALGVDQYEVAVETENLMGLLDGLEAQIQLPDVEDADPTAKETIAEKSKQLQAVLQDRISVSQLRAVFALRKNDIEPAGQHESDAVSAFADAETLFDDIMKLAIQELDKAPVQDPIASLLDDPTLDELLAMLENERDFADLLGIPNRPTNLQIIGDWLQPGGGGGATGGAMMQAFIQQQQAEAEKTMQKAYQEAIARALRENQNLADAARQQFRTQSPLSDWNVVASELEDELLQSRGQLPPEQYRAAIEQYFSKIVRALDEDSAP